MKLYNCEMFITASLLITLTFKSCVVRNVIKINYLFSRSFQICVYIFFYEEKYTNKILHKIKLSLSLINYNKYIIMAIFIMGFRRELSTNLFEFLLELLDGGPMFET